VKPTNPGLLVGVGIAGILVGFAVDQILTGAGRATFTPVLTLPILLVLLGGVIVVLALPIRRAIRGAGTVANPFRALRIAMLAKASSLVGALVAGVGIGLAVFVLTRPVEPPLGSLSAIFATVVGGGVLTAAALVAERWCTIRKDDDDDSAGTDRGPDAAPHL
jgi:hypothetical protein